MGKYWPTTKTKDVVLHELAEAQAWLHHAGVDEETEEHIMGQLRHALWQFVEMLAWSRAQEDMRPLGLGFIKAGAKQMDYMREFWPDEDRVADEPLIHQDLSAYLLEEYAPKD